MSRVKNKRSTKRHDCLVPVDGKRGSRFAEVQTIDISKGGLGLISKQALPLDKEIAVEIETAPDAQPILVMGKVVWVHKLNDEGRYRVGMKFKKAFSPEAQKKIHRLTSI